MSSPVQQDKDLNVELMYAPPWVRDQARGQTREGVRSGLMPTQPANLDWPPAGRQAGDADRAPVHRDGPYAVDVAVLQLKRQLTLDPEMVPQPPIVYPTERRPQLALRIGAVVTVAGLVAFGVTFGSLPAMKRGSGDAAVTAGFGGAPVSIKPRPENPAAILGAPPKLVTEDRSGAANEALPAGISLEGDAADATVSLAGLAPETRLSAGSRDAAGIWNVSAQDLAHLKIQAPPGFIGAMNVTVDLRLANERIADSQVVRMEWADASKSADAAVEPAPAPASAPAAEARTIRLAPDEIATMVRRGEDFLRNGDLAAARVLLRRAAEAGSAGAAFALGASYDPHVIQQIGAIGAIADAGKARSWYQKAVDLGLPAASQRLEQLAQTRR